MVRRGLVRQPFPIRNLQFRFGAHPAGLQVTLLAPLAAHPAAQVAFVGEGEGDKVWKTHFMHSNGFLVRVFR